MTPDDDAPIFRKILGCVALSPFAGRVVREATWLSRLCGSELVLLHVGDSPTDLGPLAFGPGEGPPGEPGAPPELVVRAGRPDRVIAREAAERGADLVFAGALEQDSLLRGVTGSVARRLVRRAERSVYLSIRRTEAEPSLRRIVACATFTATDTALLGAASELARRAGAPELHVVHEFSPQTMVPGPTLASQGADADAYSAMEMSAHRFQLANLLASLRLDGTALRAECLAGRDMSETVRYAERCGADLLIVPSPAQPIGLTDRFFEHPVETVLDRLPCSVLFYRATGAAAKPPGERRWRS